MRFNEKPVDQSMCKVFEVLTIIIIKRVRYNIKDIGDIYWYSLAPHYFSAVKNMF